MKRDPGRRVYRQSRRAEMAAQTAEHILDAAQQLVGELWLDELTLEDIAERAGVTVKTIMRRFGSRDGVIQAMVDRFDRELMSERLPLPEPGDVAATVRILIDYLEEWADFALRLMSQQMRYEFMDRIVKRGLQDHRRWIAAALRPQLEGFPAAERERVVLEVVHNTGGPTWKFYRRDLGYSRRRTEQAMEELVQAILAGHSRSVPSLRDAGHSQ